MLDGIILSEIIASIFWTFMGLGLMIACFLILDRISHFSIQTEISEKQNIAVAVLVGLAGIAIAIMISSVIK